MRPVVDHSESELWLLYIVEGPAVVITLIFLIPGVAAAVVGFPDFQKEAHLRFRATETTGIFLEKGAEPVKFRRGGHGMKYALNYRFTTSDGREILGWMIPPNSAWDHIQLQPGSEVPVIYSSKRPEWNRIAGYQEHGFSQDFPFVVCVISTTLILLAWMWWYQSAWATWYARLITNGNATIARIVEITPVPGKSTLLHLDYPVVNADGSTGVLSVQHDSSEQHWKVGDELLILYNPLNPAEYAVDRFDARREDRLRLLPPTA